MKRRVLILIIALAVLLSANIAPLAATPDPDPNPNPNPNPTPDTAAKIGERLKNVLESTPEDGLIPVFIWTTDIDHTDIARRVKENTGLSFEEMWQAMSLGAEMERAAEIIRGAESEDLKEWLERTEDARALEMEQTDILIAETRALSREAYNALNWDFLDENGIKSDRVVFSSQYAPMMILNATPTEIEAIQSKKEVLSIDYYEEPELKDENLTIINSSVVFEGNYTRDVLGLTGFNVRIGMVETLVPNVNHPELLGKSITTLTPVPPVLADHANLVACIMVGTNGMAPDARLYAIGTSNPYNRFTATEALLAYNVRVINASIGTPDHNYSDDVYSQWIDHLSPTQAVTFVASAGNDGINQYVTGGGHAYNGITVGAVNTNSTTSITNDTIWNNTSMVTLPSDAVKPELFAPGTITTPSGIYDNLSNTVSGTSFAAPFVTGLVAQLIQASPTLGTNSRLVKALLLAGAHDINSRTEYQHSTSLGPTVSAHRAGSVNARLSYFARNNIWVGTLATGVSVITSANISVPSGAPFIRVALVWDKRNTYFNPNGSPGTQPVLTNLDLRLINSAGQVVAVSQSTRNGLELIHFSPSTAIPAGNYKIEVRRGPNAATAAEPFAVVWRITN